MERSVRGEDDIEWTCVQAFAGVAQTAGSEATARATGRATSAAGTVPVVCTPSRAEPTVRIELPEDWAEGFSDEQLLRALGQARGGG